MIVPLLCVLNAAISLTLALCTRKDPADWRYHLLLVNIWLATAIILWGSK